MSEFDRAVLSPAERLFSKLPMGTEPSGRAIYGLAAGAAVTFGLKPSIMFNANGSPRPWIFLDNNAADNPTVFPWWAGVAAPAVFFSMFL